MMKIFQTTVHSSCLVNICWLPQGPVGLCEAVRRCDLNAVKLLIDDYRNVDQRNEQGHAPLHLACVLGYMLVTSCNIVL